MKANTTRILIVAAFALAAANATAQKVSDLPALVTPVDGDFLNILDVSDTTAGPAGSQKKITIANFGVDMVARAMAEFNTQAEQDALGIVTKTGTQTISGDKTFSGAVTLGALAADSINDTHIDWGTGANQVAAGDVPIADTGAIFTATTTEAALLELAKVPTNTKAGAYTIGTDDPRECYGGLITVTAAATITGPATLVEGMSWTIKANVAGAVVFNPDDSDTITLDGTALAAGDSITSTSTLGDTVVCVATGANSIDATSDGWTDTN